MDIRRTYIVNAPYMQVLTLKPPTPQNGQTHSNNSSTTAVKFHRITVRMSLFLTQSKPILSFSPENIRKPHFVYVLRELNKGNAILKQVYFYHQNHFT